MFCFFVCFYGVQSKVDVHTLFYHEGFLFLLQFKLKKLCKTTLLFSCSLDFLCMIHIIASYRSLPVFNLLLLFQSSNHIQFYFQNYPFFFFNVFSSLLTRSLSFSVIHFYKISPGLITGKRNSITTPFAIYMNRITCVVTNQ